MIDTHAHLNFLQLSGQIETIVAESKKAGLTGIVIAGSNLKDSMVSIELVKKYPAFLSASVGIHPQNTNPDNQTQIENQLLELENLIKSNKSEIPNSKLETSPNFQNSNSQNVSDFDIRASNFGSIVAIGETGLDFSPAPQGESDRNHEDQEKLFQKQIDLAKKYQLPLIIHAREAVDEVISILQRSSPRDCRGVFHCYAGGKKRITKVLDLAGEWYFGFDGNLTYDEGLQGIIPFIPKERIIIETDSPFLTPIPYRGEINTPANLPFIQQKINEILKEDLTDQVLQNTKILFNLP